MDTNLNDHFDAYTVVFGILHLCQPLQLHIIIQYKYKQYTIQII